jgi:tRNA threonylcarbamoyladenosine biosynthesis protein TsaB
MITLALDTSTPRGAVALLKADTPIAEEFFWRQPRASDPPPNLFGIIQRLLAGQHLCPAQVDLWTVGIGPGSFTGIRVGIAAIKGLALPWSRPIKSAVSFDAIALAALPAMPPDCVQICVLSDARRDEIYFALYDRHARRTGEIRIGALEQLADEIHDPIWFVSPEIQRYRDHLAAMLGGFASTCPTPVHPRAAAIGQLALQRYRADNSRPDHHIAPLYLRTPDYKPL